MVAQVFSFLKAKNKFSPAADWSTQEISEFYRVEASLIQSGMGVSVDRGVTDEGDPWFVFCRPSDGEVIIHFARIGSDYLIVSEASGQTLRGPDFRRLLTDFSAINPTLVPLRKAEASAKLFIHPAALLAAVVAAAFFHSSGSEAVASEISADGHDELALLHRTVAVHQDARSWHVGDTTFDTDRHETDRLVIAAMAAMIGLAAFEQAPLGGGIVSSLTSALLDVSTETFHQPKIAVSHLAIDIHDGNRAPSDDFLSLNYTSPSAFLSPFSTEYFFSREANHFVVSVRNLDGFAASVGSDFSFVGQKDWSEVPIHAFTNVDGFQFITPLSKFANIKTGTDSLVAAVTDKPSVTAPAPSGASAVADHASAEKVAQPFLTIAMDIVSGDISATTRSVTVTTLREDLALSSLLKYAARHIFGENITVGLAGFDNPSFHPGNGEIDARAVGLPISATSSPVTGSVVSAVTTAEERVELTGSKDNSFSGPTSSALLVANMPPTNTTTTSQATAATHSEFTIFDVKAESVLRSFITGNQTEIFTTGKDVVVVDVENHHDDVNDIFIKSWSAADGSTISIIGHAAHVDIALV